MTELNNSTHNEKIFTLYRIFLIFIFVYGIYIRLVEYLANRSVWFDEAYMALDIIGKSFFELLTQTQPATYTAPLGFVLLTKLLVLLLGKSEFVFRAIPLISSFVSFFVLYQLLIKCLPKKFALLPLFLFATSYELLRYATEFKPYSSDVLFALVIPLTAISVSNNKYTFKTGITYGIIGAIVLWFSFPSLFMLGGVGIVLFFSYVVEKKWENIKNLLISFFCWSVSFILMYFLFLKKIGSNISLKNYWEHSYMPLPPYTISDQFWFMETFLKIFYYPGGLNQALVGLIAFIVGAYAIFKKQKKTFYMLLSPLFLSMIEVGFKLSGLEIILYRLKLFGFLNMT